MKKRIQNNGGYALVTVLLMVTVFMIVAFSFMGQSASSTKQNKIVEQNSQSVALAEMGITYFEHYIRNIYETNYQQVLEQVNRTAKEDIEKSGSLQENDDYKRLAILLTEELFQKELTSSVITIEDKPSSFFKIQPVQGKNNFIERNQDGITIRYESVGTENEKQTTMNAAVTIQFNHWGPLKENGLINPPLQANSYVERVSVTVSGNNPLVTYKSAQYSSFIFEKDVEVKGNKILLIHGDALFNSTVNLDGNPATLKVKGDAYFSSEIEQNGNEEKANICIEGNAYVWSGSNYTAYTNLVNSCSSPDKDGSWNPIPVSDPASFSINVTYPE